MADCSPFSKCFDAISKERSLKHPCMSHTAHSSVARLHLPVAPNCNIKCNYCERSICPSNIHEICPGLAEKIFSPLEALMKANEFVDKWGETSVIGISGPGEPLANKETIITLKLIRKVFKDIKLCLCTNGLNLYENIDDIISLNIKNISVTINGFDSAITEKIYSWVSKDGKSYRGKEGANVLIKNQLSGIEKAIESGITIKINSVVIPGINDDHIIDISKKIAKMECYIHNIIPLIPRGDFCKINKPSQELVENLRKESGKYIEVFSNCKQCRADASGIPQHE